MRYERFRGAPFVNREKEEEAFLAFLKGRPSQILVIYGPRNSGKTTLVEYVLKKLPQNGYFWVRYVNLRTSPVSSYHDFVELFSKRLGLSQKNLEDEAAFSFNLIGLRFEFTRRLKSGRLRFFDALAEKLEKVESSGARPVLVIDELQGLRGIRSGERKDLIREFLNFCVSFTKERHIAHVVLVISNTTFMESVFQEARLDGFVQGFRISHLEKDAVLEWLKVEGFSREDAEVVWDFLGGCPGDLVRLIDRVRAGVDLRDFLEEVVEATEAGFSALLEEVPQEEREAFLEMAEELVRKGSFQLRRKGPVFLRAARFFSEREMVFYDPLTFSVFPESRRHQKALEKLFSLR